MEGESRSELDSVAPVCGDVSRLGLVSVIIPAYNAAGLIGETLQSIFRQSYDATEVLVVDDGSTDNTAEVVRAYAPKVTLLWQPNSGGCSSPRNHGLRLAQGEFVTFFDADDLMVPDKLQRQVDFLRRNPGCDTVLMDYRNFDEHGEASQTHFASCDQLRREAARYGGEEFLLDAYTATRILITENYAIAGSPMMRRSVFERVQPFDENLRASEDLDLIYRLARDGGLGIIAATGFLRRMHESNMSRRTGHILQYKIASREKLLVDEASSENRRLLERQIANFHMAFAEFDHPNAPGRALRHIWTALKFGHPPDLRVAKELVKSVLSAVKP
ncbi:hypothetical protein ACG33_10135 [Steroidobacter denitrificans]|uniref:Glycosyltransferase 2-like domain-containing protein n=1 Tax=Steroidobacter denitrificans TaxID=465721 RepID=A0A127FD08_STEDE|nr:glycosyltransferase family A protein [Steroidobacter denitrificans]AMN47449.1 hypothetical protein ACG33_10135 [Steroidobacter denitrificans]